MLATTAYTLSQLGRFADALAAARQARARAGSGASAEVRREASISLTWASIQTGRLSEAREAVHQALDHASVDDSPDQVVSLRALLGFIDAAGGVRSAPPGGPPADASAVRPRDAREERGTTRRHDGVATARDEVAGETPGALRAKRPNPSSKTSSRTVRCCDTRVGARS